MKQILLAIFLIAVPVALFTGYQVYFSAEQAVAAPLGDLTAMKAIIADVQKIAATGDFDAAEKRISDFESLWDDNEEKLRPMNEKAWGFIDKASDAALHALRAGTPDAAKVNTALAALMAALDSPGGGASEGGLKLIDGIAVTDDSGHPIACETMITTLRAAIDGGKIAADKVATARDFLGKATERCNADDDAHADEFSAHGLALAGAAK